jgi:hypothetical protein
MAGTPHWDWLSEEFGNALGAQVMSQLGINDAINYKKAKSAPDLENLSELDKRLGLVVTPRKSPEPRHRQSQTAPRRV